MVVSQNTSQELTLDEVRGYVSSHNLTRMQSRIVGTCMELMIEKQDMLKEIASLKEAIKQRDEYQRRANVKPTVLLVQDLSRHGAVSAYCKPDEVTIKRLIVYPWSTVAAEMARVGKPWSEMQAVEYLESPYTDELSIARAMELESKRATIEGCDKVLAMKQAISDCVPLLQELQSLKEKLDG